MTCLRPIGVALGCMMLTSGAMAQLSITPPAQPPTPAKKEAPKEKPKVHAPAAKKPAPKPAATTTPKPGASATPTPSPTPLPTHFPSPAPTPNPTPAQGECSNAAGCLKGAYCDVTRNPNMCQSCAAGRFSVVEASISDTCADCAAELFSFGGASACCAPGLVAVGGVPCTSDASALLAASDAIVLGAGTFTWLTEQTIASKNVTIVGAGASSTIIDAQGKARLFMILSGGHVAVKHVTITGGKAVRAESDCASLLILLCALC